MFRRNHLSQVFVALIFVNHEATMPDKTAKPASAQTRGMADGHTHPASNDAKTDIGWSQTTQSLTTSTHPAETRATDAQN